MPLLPIRLIQIFALSSSSSLVLANSYVKVHSITINILDKVCFEDSSDLIGRLILQLIGT